MKGARMLGSGALTTLVTSAHSLAQDGDVSIVTAVFRCPGDSLSEWLPRRNARSSLRRAHVYVAVLERRSGPRERKPPPELIRSNFDSFGVCV